MKTFVTRFYLVLIAVGVLLIEFIWVGVLTAYQVPDDTFEPGKAGSTLATQLLFPLLLVIGTVSHVFTLFTKKKQKGKE